MAQHPTPAKLQEWLDGRLDTAQSEDIKAHLETCKDVCPSILDWISNGRAQSTLAPQPGEPVTSPPPLAADVPETIGRYRVVKILGEGGFGRVYLAQDDQLNRAVAIKVPRRRSLSAGEVDAYLSEAVVVANLDHPHIVPVHDIGTTPDGTLKRTARGVPAFSRAAISSPDRPRQIRSYLYSGFPSRRALSSSGVQ